MTRAACFVPLCLALAAGQAPKAAPKPAPKRVFEIRAFGAKGDGSHDDTAAIQSAIDAAAEAGGGTVHIPKGTFLLATPHGAHGILLTPRSRVDVVGEGDESVLKAADHLNGPGRTFNVMRLMEDGPEKSLESARYSRFKVDCNGYRNLVPKGEPGKSNVAIGARRAEHIGIDHVTVVNNAGQQCFSFGNNVKPQFCRDITVTDCTFRNLGGGLRGNENQNDHSALYIQAIGVTVTDNTFTNEVLGPSTAMEIHSSDVVCRNNTADRFAAGFNVVATVTDQVHALYEGNVIKNCRWGFYFWCWPGQLMQDVVLRGNTIEQVNTAEAAIEANAQVKAQIHDTTIEGNRIVGVAPAGADKGPGILVGNFKSCAIKGNTFQGLAGRAVSLGAIAENELVLDIEENTVVDCGRNTAADESYHTAFALYSNHRIRALKVVGNRVDNPGGGLQVGLNGNAGITWGQIRGNRFQNLRLDLKWDPKAPMDYLLVEHDGNGSPEGLVRAHAGSKWTDRRNGRTYLKQDSPGESRGWRAQ